MPDPNLKEWEFVTADVFTSRRFGGNPLAVFPDARGLSDADMQALAREWNYSETTFVLPPADPAHTACVRIFGPAHELPFAGHPNVGTALVLAARMDAPPAEMVFEELAGLVRIALSVGDGEGMATLEAPLPLQLGPEVPVDLVAACAGLRPNQVLTGAHGPVVASCGLGFAVAEVAPDALGAITADTAAFREAMAQAPSREGGFSLLAYSRDGDAVRARMFAPLAGIPEDPATGSAACALAVLLLHALDRDAHRLTIRQGVEMGRPSLLHAHATRGTDGVRAGVGGGAVMVFQGVAVV